MGTEKDIKKDIKVLTFGALYNHAFKMLDHWGELADELLLDEKYFPGTFFPNITSQYTVERELTNPDNGNSLKVSANNLIYQQTTDESMDFTKEFNDFRNRICGYINPRILREYNLVIRRIGVVYTCNLGPGEINKFARKYFQPSVSNITDFRFAKKEATQKGSCWSGTSDFINKIYTVGNFNDNEGISYDYQLHLIPPHADIRDILDGFLSASLEDFDKDVVRVIEGKDEKK